MFDQFDKIYVINLKRRPDRLRDFFQNNQPFFNHKNVEVYEALDGNLIDDPEWKFEKGALGCWHTHLNLLRKINELNFNKVLILEDDAKIDRLDLVKNQEIQKFIGKEAWDMFYFGCYHHKPPSQISDTINKLNWALTTHAYALKCECIPKILEYSQTRKYWIDGVYAELHSFMNVYGTRENMIIQTNSKSDIESSQNVFMKYFEILKAKLLNSL